MIRPTSHLALDRSRRDRSNLHDQVAARLGYRIAQGTLKQGDILPKEDALGLEHGVSRTALREAIKVLASKGLVEVRRKTGTRIRPQSDWNMLDPEVLGWMFSGRGIPAGLGDLLEVRRLIEPAASRMAAERATVEELETMKLALQAMENTTNDLQGAVEADLQLHFAILEASHNPFMRSFGALVGTALRASFRFTSRNPLPYARSLELHCSLCVAICDRDPEKAEQAMLAVLSQTSADVAEQIQVNQSQKTVRHIRRNTAHRG